MAAGSSEQYQGPRISEDQALQIALDFIQEHQLPVDQHLTTQHRRPIRYGLPGDEMQGLWCVTFSSLVPPDPPNVVTSPAPDSPFLILINDQTGNASLFERL